MAESTPPFHDVVSAGDLRDRWPPLTRSKEFSRSLHDFLTLCSNPVASRPDVGVLSQVSSAFSFLSFGSVLLVDHRLINAGNCFCRCLLSEALLDALLPSRYSRSVEQSRAYSMADNQAPIFKAPFHHGDWFVLLTTHPRPRSTSTPFSAIRTQTNVHLHILTIHISPLHSAICGASTPYHPPISSP